MESLAPKTEGNLPALFYPGPTKRGIIRIKVEDAKKESYDAASFFTSFLSFFNFFRSSCVIAGTPAAFASSTCFASPIMQTLYLFDPRGAIGKRREPEKRLSLFGS